MSLTISKIVSIFSRSKLPKDFFTSRLVEKNGRRIAVGVFKGEAAATHELNHSFQSIRGHVTKLLEDTVPDGLILDFTHLKYEWGDRMACCICDPKDEMGEEFPYRIVISSLNKVGLTSLIENELFDEEPSDWLVGSMEEALALVAG